MAKKLTPAAAQALEKAVLGDPEKMLAVLKTLPSANHAPAKGGAYDGLLVIRRAIAPLGLEQK